MPLADMHVWARRSRDGHFSWQSSGSPVLDVGLGGPRDLRVGGGRARPLSTADCTRVFYRVVRAPRRLARCPYAAEETGPELGKGSLKFA